MLLAEIILLVLAISMLTPILLHDIFGVRFYKNETKINMSAWLRNNILKIKKRISGMRSKIKGDYVIAFVVFLSLLSVAIFLITNGKSSRIPELWQWVVVSILGIITIYIIVRLSGVKKLNYHSSGVVKGFKGKFKRKWLGWIIAVPILVGAGIFIYYQIQKGNGDGRPSWSTPTTYQSSSVSKTASIDLSSYKELIIGKENSFEAGEWKKFKFEPSHTEKQKYLNFYTKVGSRDTVLLNFKMARNGVILTWKLKIWRDADDTPGSEIIGLPEISVGDCAVQSDKKANIVVKLE